jgi:hypothetical protein
MKKKALLSGRKKKRKKPRKINKKGENIQPAYGNCRIDYAALQSDNSGRQGAPEREEGPTPAWLFPPACLSSRLMKESRRVYVVYICFLVSREGLRGRFLPASPDRPGKTRASGSTRAGARARHVSTEPPTPSEMANRHSLRLWCGRS